MGKDVINFSMSILNEGQSSVFVNRTDIVLIPKIPNTINLANFRPISLCSILYKVMEKGMTNRLQGVIGKCIDQTQCAFVSERLITDNVFIAYELLHGFI